MVDNILLVVVVNTGSKIDLVNVFVCVVLVDVVLLLVVLVLLDLEKALLPSSKSTPPLFLRPMRLLKRGGGCFFSVLQTVSSG